MTVNTKICGVTRKEDAELAMECGAWAIGLNFYRPSPRYISPDQATSLLGELRTKPPAIGIFVDESLAEVNRVVRTVGLWGVQLHGHEPPDYARRVEAQRVIKAFRVAPGFETSAIERYPECLILLDALGSAPGGTGETVDWTVAREIGKRFPVFLAGGITPDNVFEALREVEPHGIDVASGVEVRPGQKDPEKVRRLFEEIARYTADTDRKME